MSDWFFLNNEAYSRQFECSLPTDAAERAAYIAQLAHEATHGPAAGLENDA